MDPFLQVPVIIAVTFICIVLVVSLFGNDRVLHKSEGFFQTFIMVIATIAILIGIATVVEVL